VTELIYQSGWWTRKGTGQRASINDIIRHIRSVSTENAPLGYEIKDMDAINQRRNIGTLVMMDAIEPVTDEDDTLYYHNVLSNIQSSDSADKVEIRVWYVSSNQRLTSPESKLTDVLERVESEIGTRLDREQHKALNDMRGEFEPSVVEERPYVDGMGDIEDNANLFIEPDTWQAVCGIEKANGQVSFYAFEGSMIRPRTHEARGR